MRLYCGKSKLDVIIRTRACAPRVPRFETSGESFVMKRNGPTFSGGDEGSNIYRCQPDGTQLERIATGCWNPFHLAFDIFGRLFAVDNLTPSKEIAPQFVSWSVARTNGTVLTGVIFEQTPEGSLVFADAQGKLTAIGADEIVKRKPQTTSIMPDNLAQTMTLQDFRDLVAFLWR
jgi:hypothetical protein